MSHDNPDTEVHLTVRDLDRLLTKVRSLGWEEGCGFHDEEQARWHVRRLAREFAGVELP